MAIIKNGILGPFQGPISTVTGYTRLGIDIIRALPEPQSKEKRSNDLEIQQQSIRFRNDLP